MSDNSKLSEEYIRSHIDCQLSWVCKDHSSMRGHLEIMKENLEAGALEGEQKIIDDLEKAINQAEEFYNAYR